MASKTAMLGWVKAFDWRRVDAGLTETPALVQVRDHRGRSWLHLCCGRSLQGRESDADDSIRTAEVLLAHGLKLDQAAFTEGDWKATPL